MQNLLSPYPARRGRQFENRSTVVPATFDSGAVKIAGAVQRQTGHGIVSIAGVVKTMQNRLGPASTVHGRQLEHRPVVVSAAPVCCAVKISGGIERECRLRLYSIHSVIV